MSRTCMGVRWTACRCGCSPFGFGGHVRPQVSGWAISKKCSPFAAAITFGRSMGCPGD